MANSPLVQFRCNPLTLEIFDRFCEEKGITRTEFILTACCDYIRASEFAKDTLPTMRQELDDMLVRFTEMLSQFTAAQPDALTSGCTRSKTCL